MQRLLALCAASAALAFGADLATPPSLVQAVKNGDRAGVPMDKIGDSTGPFKEV